MKICEDLRRSILQAAIQGKLTQQKAEDGTAEDLLKEIKKEKEKLIAEGRIKREKLMSQQKAKISQKFDIPNNWAWCHLGDITFNRDSERIPISASVRATKEKLYDYYGASGVIDKIDNYLFSESLLLIGEDGANLLSRSTPIAFIATGKYWVNNHAHVLGTGAYISMKYLCLCINSQNLSPYVSGTAQPKMNQENMNAIWIPLPPLAEQHRIVKRVDALMSKINELEKVENELEAIKKKFPDDMRDALLQAAIQGKLTQQKAEDGTAEDLLKEIKKEKEKLIVEGKIKREKTLPPIKDDEIPFEIPENWRWSYVSSINYTIGNKNNKILAKDIMKIGKYPVITQGKKFIDGYYNDECKVINDAPVIMFGDHTRNVKYINFPFIIGADGTKFMRTIVINSEYFYYCVSFFSKTMKNRGYERHFSLLSKELIPLPPLAEQHRIVKRLNELLPLCEAMKGE